MPVSRPSQHGRTGRLAGWLLALVAAAGACTLVGDELYPPFDELPPEVLETFPADGWRQVPTGISLRVWFSEPIDPDSIGRNQASLFSGDHLQACRYSVEQEPDGRGLVVIEPLDLLIPGVRYRLDLTVQITDLAGNPLPGPVSISFETVR